MLEKKSKSLFKIITKPVLRIFVTCSKARVHTQHKINVGYTE